jgi:aminoglycoside phosphotransferase (APT) family kinase protein
VNRERQDLIEQTLGRTPRELVEIDDGYDFEVAIVDRDWVFRFPRRANVAEALEVEIAALPILAAALPIAVPHFEHVSREPPFVAYRAIHGEPLVDEDPEGVRAFLSALHGLDAAELPLERPAWVGVYVARCERFAHGVLPLLDADERPRARAFFAEASTLTGFDAVPIHGDVLPEHLRCHGRRLAGVIDWGDACVGDPALDYAWLLNVPFPHWDVDDDLRRRARFHYRLEPWVWAHYGLVTEQPALVRAGLAEIRTRL